MGAPTRHLGARPAATLLLGVVVAAAFIIVQLMGHPWMRRIESDAHDWRVRRGQLLQKPISSDIVHVDIDEQALRRLGKWPWERGSIAELVLTLKEAGAKVVVLDILTEDPESARWERLADGTFSLISTDLELAEAMIRAGNVVLAADVAPVVDAPRRVSLEAPQAMTLLRDRLPRAPGVTLGIPGRAVAPPRPLFLDAAAGIGAVHLSIESSELSVHEIPAWQTAADLALPHLGVVAAATYLDIPMNALAPRADQLDLGPKPYQLRQGVMLVPWVMRSTSDRSTPWLRDLSPDAPAWLRVHRHVSAAPIVELGERRRATRQAVSFLLARPMKRQPTADELRQADEEAEFLLSPYVGKDLNAVREKLESDPSLESQREAATLTLLMRYQELRRRAADEDQRDLELIRDIVKDKLVFFGWIATGAAVDMHRTPLGARTPGVVVHAAVADGILTGRTLALAPRWANILATATLAMCATLLASWLPPNRAWLAVGAMAILYVVINVVWVYNASGIAMALGTPLLAAGGCWAACTTHRAVVLRAEKASIRRQFSARVPTSLVNYLADRPELTNVEGEEREITVLFSDFTGFAAASEQMDGRSTVALLNTYLRALTDVVQHHGGYVNKFLGDGVMAFWNAPIPTADHASRACRAVVEASHVITQLNAVRASTGEPELPLRVGVATGKVIVGDCGAPPALNDYTAIGEAVNLASRLESANKQLGTDVLLSGITIERLSDADRAEFALRPLGLVRVMGASKASEVWELVGRGPMSAEVAKWIKQTEEAVRLFRSGDYANAIEAWRELVLFERGQAGALLYVQRCAELIQGGYRDNVLPLRGK